ncbi:hypothetical protein BJP36_05910 [Moorena producens JHB]|uniref:Uncharacterized protein n=1 Tax=Moorena producens (strain JHB) TaxID=1454205 RepID=A0A9Q9UVT0_MOOP1|nr:hypothetical protein [Moorena producens]WAN69156.1 hypothetical protein BJP36_05910 [Moorena producens JHB]
MLKTAARYINRHSQPIDLRSRYANEQNQADITQLRVSLNETLRLFSELATYQRQSQEDIRQNQAEIRRIWEYLLSQSDNGRSGN